MNSHILVTPLSENILGRLGGQRVVIRLKSLPELPEAVSYARRFRLHIHCCWYRTEAALTSLDLGDYAVGVPLAIYASGLGPIPEFIRQLPTLRKLNLRIYLPTDSAANYASFRILASLGLASAVLFAEPGPDWELLSDLMTYALLGLAPHAAIDPFYFLSRHYERNRYTDYNAVYFADPRKYLHVDAAGRIALSPEDLAKGLFLNQGLDRLAKVEECEEYTQRLEAWRDFFLQPEGCAYCQGWRICLGKFAQFAQTNPGCVEFFSELMEVIETYQAVQGKKKLWQP